MTSNNHLPVAVIGAGPVGMAAAAHLSKRNIPFVLFESGTSVGSSILSWSHINVFSTWKMNIDKIAREMLEKTNWRIPNEDIVHSGGEFVDQYLKPLAELPQLKESIYTNSKVIAIGRKDMDKMKTKNRENVPFVVRVQHADRISVYEVRAIIDASGNWLTPNPVGSGGNFAMGELENADKIFYGIPDVTGKYKMRYANKKVAVVGAGHSAFNTIFELEKLKEQYPNTEINWILRKQNVNEAYGGKDADALEARGAIGVKIENLVNQDMVNIYTPFRIDEIRKQSTNLMLVGYQNNRRVAIPGIDEIISNTGSRPDFSFLREVRLSINEAVESVDAIADLIDPNIHSCGSVRPHGELELQHPEKNFYIAGSKSYGRAPTFLMATGYEQVRSIVAALDGDLESARKVELILPETGVCNAGGDAGCCA